MDGCGCGGGIGAGAALRDRRGDRLAEQVAGRAGWDGPDGVRADREPRRHTRHDGVEQFGGVRGASPGVDVDTGLGRALDHGEPRVEAGAPPGIGAAVDRHGEDGAGAALDGVEGVPPGGVARDAVGRGDGGEAAARRQHGKCRAEMAQIRVVADALDARRRGERRVHQHHRRPDVVEPVGDGFRVEGGRDGLGEEPGQEAGAGLCVFVEMQMAGGVLAEGAPRHHRQHAGAGRGLQHGIARPDRGGPERGIGERQRRRELLQADLLVRALRVRGFERGKSVEHCQHGAGAVRTGARTLAHGPAVALHEQHDGGFGGLVGVLPDPAALGVRRAEGPRHRIPEDRGIERPAGLQGGQQTPGRGEQGIARDRTGRRCGRVDGKIGKGRTRVRVRRRMGVEHGDLRAGRA